VTSTPPSPSSPLLAELTDEPTRTEELYDRVGYLSLVRAGLVPYPAFRGALAELEAAGLAVSETAADGSTLWRRTPPSEP
jgi:hypothetical protein